MKRRIVLLCSISLLTALVLASCSKEEPKGTTSAQVETVQSVGQVEEKSTQETNTENLSSEELFQQLSKSSQQATADFWK